MKVEDRDDLFVSLVVGTADRSVEVIRLLDSFADLQDRDFEVILVDQNEHVEFKLISEKYGEKYPLKYLRFPEKNASKARNFGAAAAAGEWIGFPDDDCVYTLDTLRELKKSIKETSADIITGAILDFNNKLLSNTYRYSCILSIFNVVGRVSEPCFFLKKNVFKELGGFDVTFGPGSQNYAGEGMELGVKAVKMNKKLFFNSEMQVLHPNKMEDLKTVDYSVVYKYSFANGLAIVSHFKMYAYYFFIKDCAFFLPRIVLRPRPYKGKFLFIRIRGLYDGIIMRRPARFKYVEAGVQ